MIESKRLLVLEKQDLLERFEDYALFLSDFNLSLFNSPATKFYEFDLIMFVDEKITIILKNRYGNCGSVKSISETQINDEEDEEMEDPCEVSSSCPTHRCKECRRYYDDLYQLT